jgi:hypothetical protein
MTITIKAFNSRGQTKYIGDHAYHGKAWTTWRENGEEYRGLVLVAGGIIGSERTNQFNMRIPPKDFADLAGYVDQNLARDAREREAVEQRLQQQAVTLLAEATRQLQAFSAAGAGFEVGSLCLRATALLARLQPEPEPNPESEPAAATQDAGH